jgi:hypothetical protein
MCTTPTITTIWSCMSIEFGPHKMPTSRTTMSAFTEHPYLIDKI